MKTKNPVLIVILAAILVGAALFTKLHFLNKLVPQKNTFTASSEYGKLSFKHPDDFPVQLQKDSNLIDIPTKGQGIYIAQFDIDKFDYSQDPRITKAEMQSYYNSLLQGKTTGTSYFSMWSLDKSNQTNKTPAGKFFNVSTTFSAFEVCDFKFYAALEIPTQNKIVQVIIYGDPDKIRTSLASSGLLKQWDGCSNTSFGEHGTERFYDLLIAGKSTPEAQDWYSAVRQVESTLEY